MKVFIGCSSKNNLDKIYIDESNKIVKYLAQNKYHLLIGGTLGLMGNITNMFNKYNCNINIMEAIPYKKDKYEYKVKYHKTIGERKYALINNADIILLLPGGLGTLDEIFTSIESKRAKEHNKEIIIANINGYYNGLITMLDRMYNDSFANTTDQNNYIILNNSKEIINYIKKIGDNNE